MAYSKIHPIALGLTLGILAGLGTLFAGLLANIFFNGKPFVTTVGSMYVTYSPTIQNSAIGGLMAFLGALVGGYVAAWVYNILCEYI
ncbi:hypothetical protein [Legionella sp. km772]|uniref:hypothetical protein n=1 Tax=Legionella sp. km772 TaxID=2498111 RepID=UPI000F8C4E0A|nr:hypothetical protein [Legionella sp. km772]RUR13660.1 hypothetical protein ELY15_01715 [Legionella sp. km772]